ncbi:hypothetical protein [Nocardioides okcheonensis]|uniref:hypothetical protein n=1 Tax=Nocardioides okcheonensis TaxID=2894081 RepID=UPI001E310DCB|nr:hypothetical protein [Nocardioides okcheonensis]UFN45692.1 hypothetical protein LN652_05635 [Nocardioides okcheonensis]
MIPDLQATATMRTSSVTGALIAADPDAWCSVIAYAASPVRQKRATAKMLRTRDSVAYVAVLVGALCALSGCAAIGDGSDDAAAVPDAATKTVNCLVNSGSVSSSKPNDPCAEFAEDGSVEEQPCDEIWQLGSSFPAPYYGCATDDGHEVFDLGVECEDPSLDGYWLYDDMMARQGGPVVASKVALLDSGHPAC